MKRTGVPIDKTEDDGRYKISRVLNVGGKRVGVGGWGASGAGRLVFEGPLVKGPVAYTFGLAAVMDNHGGTAAESARRKAEGSEEVCAIGDEVIVDGIVYRIEAFPYTRDEFRLVRVGGVV